MKIQLLPTSFDDNGNASARQHLCCFVIDDRVAIDAGSLAMAASESQRENVRDIILSHAHLDHIAGLPLFVDDLFAGLKSPIRIHAQPEVIETLERDVFNWAVYPRFSELKNEFGDVMTYHPFENIKQFQAAHLSIKPISVNHRVPASGFIINDEVTKIAVSGDTAENEEFWEVVNSEENLEALLIECAFPNSLSELAFSSHHLSPARLQKELNKFQHSDCPIFAVNLKPMYREKIVEEISQLEIDRLKVLEVGRIYEF